VNAPGARLVNSPYNNNPSKGMLDSAMIGLFHVTPKLHLWILKLLQINPF